MGSTRKTYTQEYRDQAVSFVLDGGRPIAQVARNIGVHEMTLGNWVKRERQARDGDETPALIDEDERAELTRLRSENAELRMQVEFAKKVATWFAKDRQ